MIFSLYFVIGATLASFSCCLGYRLGKGQTPWSPKRSYCDNCHHPLALWQLLPVGGWLIQGGHCHYCKKRISPFLPVSEVIAGSTVALFCPGTSYIVQLFFTIIISTLVILASSDFFYCFIYPPFLLGLTPLFFTYHPTWSLINLLLVITFLLFLLTCTIKFHSLGIGDLEFITVIFIALGCYPSIIIILLASLLTLSLYPLFHKKVPFIPGLALATTIVLVYLKQKAALG